MAGQATGSEHENAEVVIRRGDFENTESVSTNVLLTLDSLPEFDAEASDEALFEYVDPDALDSLFRSPPDSERAVGWVSFPVADYEVSVSASGDIVVRADSS